MRRKQLSLEERIATEQEQALYWKREFEKTDSPVYARYWLLAEKSLSELRQKLNQKVGNK